MRLIDADVLETKLEEQRKLYIEMDMKGAEHLLVHDVLHHVWEAPTIDAVQVIRCKDCKHWYNDGDAITWCNLSKWACGGNGFCLYAERKDNE